MAPKTPTAERAPTNKKAALSQVKEGEKKKTKHKIMTFPDSATRRLLKGIHVNLSLSSSSADVMSGFLMHFLKDLVDNCNTILGAENGKVKTISENTVRRALMLTVECPRGVKENLQKFALNDMKKAVCIYTESQAPRVKKTPVATKEKKVKSQTK
jgi:hypothetical protein